MEGKEEDVKLGANKYSERQPIGTAAQTREKDYTEPGPAPLIEFAEFSSWSFYRAGIAEFMATFLFLYITILTVMGVKRADNVCTDSVGIQGIAWAFGGMIFCLVYCTAGISGGHINPAVTFGLFLARKLSLPRALFYMICQCLGAICGAGVVKGFMEHEYELNHGGANIVAHGYTKGDGLGAEIVGTFVLVYTVFSATDAKRSARDSHVPLLAPLPIGFAVFVVHLATIPITGTGINPARSLGAAIVYDSSDAWHDHGLEILENLRLLNVIIEGDSELVIRHTKRIQNGTDPIKLSHHWKLSQILERIKNHLKSLKTVSFNYVKREANMVADKLANEGVTSENYCICLAWNDINNLQLKNACSNLARKDIERSLKETQSSKEKEISTSPTR